jgi:hypothetical protein
VTPSTDPRLFRHPSFHGRVGIARADITPPVGVYARNWGAAKHDVAREIHRPLTLTAMTLAPANAGQPLIYIDADLGWWKSMRTFRDFEARLQQALDVNPANLIFALSHTHSAPPLMDAPESLPGGEIHRTWIKQLFDATVSTVRTALASQFAATIEWHKGHCSLATNRDLLDPDVARQRYICGYNPSGDPDDTLLVGRISDETGRIRGTLVNYACHPTTLAWDNESISPDYVGAMRETVQTATDAPALFMLGACGELAPRYQYVGDPAVADQHGRELGFAALATLNGMEPPGEQLSYAGVVESGAPLAAWKHTPSTPSQKMRSMRTTATLALKDWPSAQELEKQCLDCSNRALEERLRRKLNIRLGIGDGPTLDLPVHVWRIGDAVLAGSCCESYSILQREMQRRFPDNPILCMNLINGSIGYLPPAELYDFDLYTVWQTPFDRGGYERLLETMTEAIRNVLND